jgi:hypothetical protein
MNRMDDLLRETLRSRAADTTAGCVDAETAAAFVDRTLSARARSSAEAHIADCPRCQAVLAALVRSTTPPMPRTWWRRPALAWLVPAAVAAGAVAIWINVPDRATPPLPVPMQKELPPPVEAVPVLPLPTAAPAAAAQAPSPVASLKDARSLPPDAARARQAAAAAAPAKPSSPSASADASERLEARQDTPSDFRVAPAPAPAVPPPAAALAESVTIRTARATIVSSDRTVQWRIGAAGDVQHSADGGASWQPQATGASLPPSAGSSPSSSVCWLVGRSGLVLLTTDGGQSWRRLPFPVVTDLASVRATDDRTATIVAVDGRTFVTSDAGSSWRQ